MIKRECTESYKWFDYIPVIGILIYYSRTIIELTEKRRESIAELYKNPNETHKQTEDINTSDLFNVITFSSYHIACASLIEKFATGTSVLERIIN
ncbi:MAG: hypothetical protein A2639_00565 [Candidatus Staskawiczbacteria bacterium RIFCSPHIGHO2_01_FULL_34_27]|uniref:Uncharacterized protein n=1 Tax=Candidatus Staskawiczbacteria bacterium RIFCSPHIGHO2_01_FULL_34_27 TaxID=1802199 RepID=A0A1G2HJT2_9BACT|nr:hypothetical protein [Candidatus Pacearchaeota archaeon]OGZ62560.1 MAG: hypothetical protein A2639_00565 [Candidatus Staskawiczbacteria bacterium RIFCSPHIGHO2_01_FULL_34_27]